MRKGRQFVCLALGLAAFMVGCSALPRAIVYDLPTTPMATQSAEGSGGLPNLWRATNHITCQWGKASVQAPGTWQQTKEEASYSWIAQEKVACITWRVLERIRPHEQYKIRIERSIAQIEQQYKTVNVGGRNYDWLPNRKDSRYLQFHAIAKEPKVLATLPTYSVYVESILVLTQTQEYVFTLVAHPEVESVAQAELWAMVHSLSAPDIS